MPMQSLREQFDRLFSKAQMSDNQIICSHLFSIRSDFINLQDEVRYQLGIIEQRIQDAGCDVAMPEVKIEYGSHDRDVRYDRDWQWKEKAEYILRKYKKPMSATEITNEIHQLEYTPGENKKESASRKRYIMTSISGVLSANTKDKVKNPAVFKRMDKTNPDDNKEPIRFWFAGEDEPSES